MVTKFSTTICTGILYDSSNASAAEEFVYDAEHDLYRFPDGKFDFSLGTT